MAKECLKFFEGKYIDTFFEGTIGAGGHAREILEHHPEIRVYIGCDKDTHALDLAKDRLQDWSSKIEFVQGNFADLESYLNEREIKTVDGFFLTWGYRLCN